jgi:ribosomal protein S18 acetylase RimI-like enzyme
MSQADLSEYHAISVREYARQIARAGKSDPASALEEAEKEFRYILPQGVATKGQYLFWVEDGETGTRVGMVWLGIRGEQALRGFIYEISIDPAYRRQGYATQTLAAVHEKAKELGAEVISLQVFAHNQAAIALYRKAGYEFTEMRMSKALA